MKNQTNHKASLKRSVKASTVEDHSSQCKHGSYLPSAIFRKIVLCTEDKQQENEQHMAQQRTSLNRISKADTGTAGEDRSYQCIECSDLSSAIFRKIILSTEDEQQEN